MAWMNLNHTMLGMSNSSLSRASTAALLIGKCLSYIMCLAAMTAPCRHMPSTWARVRHWLMSLGIPIWWTCFSRMQQWGQGHFPKLRVLLVYQIRTRLFPWACSFKNFQQFSESIDTVYWYRAITLLPMLHHVNKCGKSDNNVKSELR